MPPEEELWTRLEAVIKVIIVGNEDLTFRTVRHKAEAELGLAEDALKPERKKNRNIWD